MFVCWGVNEEGSRELMFAEECQSQTGLTGILGD